MRVRGRYLPALDGIRAVAVVAVIAYHLGFSWAGGGYLGVDLFFVLSGFLITSLLLEERLMTGLLALGSFWGRRARRLLPGLLVMLVGLGVFLALFGGGPLADLHEIRMDAVATVLYFANWHQLFAHQSYFSQYQAPSPLEQTWSLGIEEQFYFVWPLLIVGVFALGRHRWRSVGLALSAGGAIASAVWMAWLAAHGAGADRLYYGTDTRAQDLLVGAVLAFLTAARQGQSKDAAVRHRVSRGGYLRDLPAVAGPIAAAGIIALFVLAGQGGGFGSLPPRWMFEGGFLVAALLAATVLAEVTGSGPSIVAKVLSVSPARYIGRISYELYLWHWPVIAELTPVRLGFGGLSLDAVRLAITMGLSIATYHLIDHPIRQWAFGGWPLSGRLAVAPLAMMGAVGVVVVGTAIPVANAAALRPTQVAAVNLKTERLGGSLRGQVPGVPGSGRIVGGKFHLDSPPTPSKPLSVVLIGDSVMRGDGPAVEAALGSTGAVRVRNDGFDGWGFTTDPTWRVGVRKQIEAAHAQVVIAMWSYDNDFMLSHPQLYRRWMSQFVNIVIHTKGVQGLIFQQFPVVGPYVYGSAASAVSSPAQPNRGVDAWNALVRSYAVADPSRVAYVPIAPSVERDGRFQFWLPPHDDWSLPPQRWTRVRAEDGVHLCPEGAARYSDALLADMTAMFDLPAASKSWSLGSWTSNPSYDQPPGNCVNDHPPSGS